MVNGYQSPPAEEDEFEIIAGGLPQQEPLLPRAEDLIKEPDAVFIRGAIERKFNSMTRLTSRMKGDYERFTLARYQPEPTDSISEEDIYTTNAPRVLAQKIISFIAATERIVRVPNDNAQEAQEEQNDSTELLAIGMLDNVDKRRRRQGHLPIVEQLAFNSVVLGRYAAVRAILRKRENGETYEDILPLDPKDLVIQHGEEEPVWAAYRISKSVQEVKDEYPDFRFKDDSMNGAESITIESEESVDVYEYYCRKPNPPELFNPDSTDPFYRHPWVYMAGTVIDDQWARPPHDLHMLNFPIVLAPVDSSPLVSPFDGGDWNDMEEHFGESVFAENRYLWDTLNRSGSLVLDLMAKASDPRKKVFSLDGTKSLDDGASEKGSEMNLSTTNQEEVENYEEADISRSAGVLLQMLQQDMVAGGLPPQAFGLLDKPLSSVALRQLGNNLEHRILPRMRAVAACIEGALENLVAQYETGFYEPITVSGRRFDNHRFANRIITPQHIHGHDPVTVEMALALPEDETTRWTVAQMAMQPTASGEPLADLEWVREHVLNMVSSKAVTRRNREAAGVMQNPVVSAKEQVEAFIRDGNMENAAAWYDMLNLAYYQQQFQIQSTIMQIQQMYQQAGLPMPPGPQINQMNAGLTTGAGQTIDQGQGSGGAASRQFNNPANGAVPYAQTQGMGNQPSPDAGAYTAAPRQRQTGLLGADGQPLMADDGSASSRQRGY